MFKNKWLVLVSILVVASLVLSACDTTPAPAPEEPAEEPAEDTTDAPAEEPADEPAADASMGGVLRMAVLEDISTRNIWAAYDPDSTFWNYAVYSGMYPALYGLTSHRWEFVPGVAVGAVPELVEEGETWTATIAMRDDVVWSDGTPVTPEDVAWTINAVTTMELGGNWLAYDFEYVAGAEAMDGAVKIIFGQKPGLSRYQYGALQGPILNSAFWAPAVDSLTEAAAALDPEADDYVEAREAIVAELYALPAEGEPGAGAFTYAVNEAGAYSESVVNEYYGDKGSVSTEYDGGLKQVDADGNVVWEAGDTAGEALTEYTEGPYFSSILFTIYNSDAALLALQSGEVDFVLTPNGVPKGQAEQVASVENISVATNPSNGFRYIGFRHEKPVMDSVALHQAVSCMVDKEFITQRVLQGAAIPVNTIVPESNAFWYNPDTPLFCEGMTNEERLVEATSILSEGGFTWEVEPSWDAEGDAPAYGQGVIAPDGTAVRELVLMAPSAGYDPLRATAAIYVGDWMSQLGFDVDVQLTGFNNIVDRCMWYEDEAACDMWILGWGLSAFPDYACDFFYSDYDFGVSGYASEELDALCDEFYVETDLEAAKAQLFTIQEVLATDLPYVYLFTTPMYDAWDNTTIAFPFTDVNDGIGGGYYGLQSLVMPQ